MVKPLEVRKDEKEPVVEEPKTDKYKNLKALFADYKAKNPVKYEKKKDFFEAQLAALKN